MNAILLFSLLCAPPPAAAALLVEGDYLEARTCDVYTGPCFANAEVNLAGREATLAWKVRSGSAGGVDLAGLSAVAVVRASATLGDPYRDAAPCRSVLYLDGRADAAQRDALRALALAQLGDLAGTVVAEHAAAIDLEVANCARSGCARLDVGDAIDLSTRCIGEDDHVCGNEEVFYPPLTGTTASLPAVAEEYAVACDELDVRFSEHGGRSAFTGAFALDAATLALAVAASASDDASPRAGQDAVQPGDATYRIEPLRMDESAEGAAGGAAAGDGADASERSDAAARSTIPGEVPDAFAKRLSPEGLRVARVRGAGDAAVVEPLYDLWFDRDVELLAEDPHEDSLVIRFGRLQIGTFVGVVRSYGLVTDYREDPVAAGVYVLRYGRQPTDGNHLGTAETRDFLVLTGFEDDRDPKRVDSMSQLEDLAFMATSAEHPMVLYIVRPEPPEGAEDEAGRPVMYEHASRDEWIASVTLSGRAPGAADPSPLPMGIVLVGVSEDF